MKLACLRPIASRLGFFARKPKGFLTAFGTLALGLALPPAAQAAHTAHPIHGGSVVYSGLGLTDCHNDPLCYQDQNLMALDSHGNLFVNDPGNRRILELKPTTGGYNATVFYTLPASNYYPVQAIVVDRNDVLYVALPGGSLSSTGDFTFLKFTPGVNGYTQSASAVPAGTINEVNSMAVDRNGDLYLAAGVLMKLTPTGSTYTVTQIQDGLPSGLYIRSVLTDPNGDGSMFYGLSSAENSIYTYTLTNNGYTGAKSAGGNLLNHGSTLSGSAIYVAGVLQYAAAPPETETEILAVTPGAGPVLSQSLFLPHIHSVNVTNVGMAIDGFGNFFVVDGTRVLKYTAGNTSTYFGALNISGSYLMSVQFQFDSTTTLGATPYKVLSYGKEDGDFAATKDLAQLDDNICRANQTYHAGDTCSVRLAFQPTAIGQRTGTVSLLDGSGSEVAITGVSGLGQSAHAVFNHPAESIARSSGLLVGADPAGAAFVYDSSSGVTYKDTPFVGGGGFTEAQLSATASAVVSAATDSTGAILLADQGYGQIVKETPNGSGGYVESVAVPNLLYALRISSDVSGGFFTLERLGPYYDQRYAVAHYIPFNGSYSRTELYSTPNAISDIAADSKGNVYLADYVNGKVSVLTLSVNVYTVSEVATIANAYRLNTDVADGVQVLTGDAIIRVVSNGDGTYSQTILYSKTPDPYNPYQRFAITTANDIFLQDINSPVMLKALSTPGRLTFASTAVGSTSTDSPTTVAMTNVGASALQFTIPGALNSGNNPSVSANFNVGTGAGTCPVSTYQTLSPLTLAPAATCTLPISFVPTAAGGISGSVTIGDTDAYTQQQTIPLSGTGSQLLDHFNITGAPAQTAAGSSITLTVTAYSDPGSTVATTYNRPVHFTSTDAQAVLPADTALVNGVGTFTVSFHGRGTFKVTVADGSGSPLADTAPISVTAGPAALLQAVSGSGQSTYIGEAFANPLNVRVTDAYGNTVTGATIVFTAPASGPSASVVVTGTTNSGANTLATATANGLSSTQQYYVVASVSGVASTVQFQLVNAPHPTSITFKTTPASVLYGAGTPVTVEATVVPATVSGSNAGGTVYFFDGPGPNYTYLPTTPHAAVVNGKATYTFPGDVTLPIGAHSFNVYYSGDSNFNYGTGTGTFNVTKSDVTVSGNAQNPITYAVGGSVPFAVTFPGHAAGIAVPSGPVQYTIHSGSNPPVATGTVTLAANGNINSQGSVPVSSSLAIGNYTLDLVYTGDANYTGGTGSLGISVARVTPTVTIGSPMPGTSRVYGAALGITASATANNASVPGIFNYTATPAGGAAFDVSALTVLRPAVYTIAANFTPTDTVNYASASASVTLTINKATPVINFADPAPITDNTPLSKTQLNATIGGVTGGDVVGTFAYTPPVGTQLSAGLNQVLGVTFTPGADDASLYTPVSATAHINVYARTAQTITFAQPAGATYGDAPFTVAPTATSGLPVTVVVQSGPATISGGTVTITGAGTIVLVASQAGDTQYEAATSVTRAVVVAGLATTTQVNVSSGDTPTLNKPFGLSIHVRNPSMTPQGTVTVTEGGVTVGTGTFVKGDVVVIVTLATGGVHTFTTTYVPANANFLASSGSIDVTIAKASQTITFADLPAKTYGDAPFTLNATSTSGLPVTFAAASSNVSVTGNVVTIVGGGTATITADQAGDGSNAAATQVVKSFTIASLATSITASQTGNAEVNKLVTVNATVTSTAAATPTGSVTFYEGGTQLGIGFLSNGVASAYVTFATGGTHTLNVVYRPSNNNWVTSSTWLSVALAKTAQTITFAQPANLAYGDAAFTIAPTASSGLPVTVAVQSGPATVSGNTVTATGAGTIALIASQAGDSLYQAATSVTRSVIVNGAATTTQVNLVSGAALPTLNKAFGLSIHVRNPNVTPQGTVTVSEGAATLGTGTFVNGDAVVQVTLASGGAHTFTTTYVPASANYLASSGNIVVNVAKASQTITFADLPSRTYGDAAFSLVATASSGLPVTYTPLTNNIVITGNSLTIVGGGNAIVAADQAGDATNDAAAQVVRSFNIAAVATVVTPSLVTATPAPNQLIQVAYSVTANGVVPSGTVSLYEGGTKLNDGSLSNGTGFAYVKFADAGTHTVTVIFNPGNSGLVTSSGTLVINAAKKSQTITFAPLPDLTFGDPPITLNATASSGLPVTYSVTGIAVTLSGNKLTFTGGGTVTVVASQTGDGTYEAAAPVTRSFNVGIANLTLVLTSSTPNVNPNTPLTYTFSGSGPGGPPTGKAYLFEGSTSLAGGTFSNGVVSETIPAGLPAGVHVLTLTYVNDGNYGTTSISFTQTVTAPSFSLVATPDPLIVHRNSTATANLTLTPVGGYKGTLTLQCGGSLPMGVSCAFSPATYVATGDNAVQTGTLRVTAGQFASLEQRSGNSKFALALLLPGACFSFCFFHKRKLPLLLLLILSFGALSVLQGCGTPAPTAASGTYAATISVGDGTSTTSVKISIVLQD